MNAVPQHPAQVVQQLATAYWASRCLHLAAELGVADVLGDEPQTAEVIAQSLGVQPGALHRILRALANHGIFQHDGARFAHNEPSRMLRTGVPGSQRSLTRMMGLKVHWDAYRELDSALRTGRPPIAQVTRDGLFPYLAEHPEFDFLHVLLPHFPWHYLPTGQDYAALPGHTNGLHGQTWANDDVADLMRVRHLLQVQAADGAQHWQTPPPRGWRTSYRRKALAAWMTDVDHGAGKLLARVIVNRLWQHHLGRGIVATPSDFGTRGERPTHPELLDWLATELIREG